MAVEIADGWSLSDAESMALTTRFRMYYRLADRMPEAEVELLLGNCASVIHEYAPDAPAKVREQALIRLAGYAYDNPVSGSALRLSGALELLHRYRVRRALPVEASGA